MKILAYISSFLPLLLSILLVVRLKGITGWFLFLLKVLAGSFSFYLAILGIAGACLGWASGVIWAIPAGLLGATMMAWYVWACTRQHKGFEKAFGADWEKSISPQQADRMLKHRWRWFMKPDKKAKFVWHRDIPYWVVPDSGRQLLCDVWQPARSESSGLGVIYLHGSGWGGLDKDTGTRRFFRHLVSQGYTVMDVAYRLLPEVDIYEMIGDVKRAVAWLKSNANHYGVNSDKIVLAGGSAGAHLALLAGYTDRHPELTLPDLTDVDVSVCGVIAYYPPTDLRIVYDRWGLKQYQHDPPMPIGPEQVKSGPRYGGRIDALLRGHPQEIPSVYDLASPSTHVRATTPPTLLIQGDRDFLIPLEGSQVLYDKLCRAGVPAINVVLPWTEHAFDLLFPQFSPPAQSALYDVDRFLGSVP